MFDLSLSESLVILLVLVLVVGPEDIPGVVKKISGCIKKIKSYARDFHDAVDEIVEETGAKDLQKEVKKQVLDLEGNITEVYDLSDVRDSLQNPKVVDDMEAQMAQGELEGFVVEEEIENNEIDEKPKRKKKKV